jgi:hypothetical protein
MLFVKAAPSLLLFPLVPHPPPPHHTVCVNFVGVNFSLIRCYILRDKMQNSRTNVFLLFKLLCLQEYVWLCETTKNIVLARKNEDNS